MRWRYNGKKKKRKRKGRRHRCHRRRRRRCRRRRRRRRRRQFRHKNVCIGYEHNDKLLLSRPVWIRVVKQNFDSFLLLKMSRSWSGNRRWLLPISILHFPISFLLRNKFGWFFDECWISHRIDSNIPNGGMAEFCRCLQFNSMGLIGLIAQCVRRITSPRYSINWKQLTSGS